MTIIVVILTALVVLWLIGGYAQDTHTKPRKKENSWDLASKTHRKRKATFFAREGDITIEKESH